MVADSFNKTGRIMLESTDDGVMLIVLDHDSARVIANVSADAGLRIKRAISRELDSLYSELAYNERIANEGGAE